MTVSCKYPRFFSSLIFHISLHRLGFFSQKRETYFFGLQKRRNQKISHFRQTLNHPMKTFVISKRFKLPLRMTQQMQILHRLKCKKSVFNVFRRRLQLCVPLYNFNHLTFLEPIYLIRFLYCLLFGHSVGLILLSFSHSHQKALRNNTTCFCYPIVASLPTSVVCA